MDAEGLLAAIYESYMALQRMAGRLTWIEYAMFLVIRDKKINQLSIWEWFFWPAHLKLCELYRDFYINICILKHKLVVLLNKVCMYCIAMLYTWKINKIKWDIMVYIPFTAEVYPSWSIVQVHSLIDFTCRSSSPDTETVMNGKKN